MEFIKSNQNLEQSENHLTILIESQKLPPHKLIPKTNSTWYLNEKGGSGEEDRRNGNEGWVVGRCLGL